MRRYGAKSTWVGELRSHAAMKLLVTIREFQIDLISDPTDIMKAHSKVFKGSQEGGHLIDQTDYSRNVLGGLYEIMRTKEAEQSGKWTHDWLYSIVRDSINDFW